MSDNDTNVAASEGEQQAAAPAVEETNYLDMSDSDIENMSFPPEELQAAAEPDLDNPDDSAADTGEGGSEDDNDAALIAALTNTDQDEDPDKEKTDLGVDNDLDTDPNADQDDDTGSSDSDSTDADTDTDTNEDLTGEDHKATVEALLAPIRANGKDITINSVEDARRLMSMGAGFHKKMANIKPNMKIIRMLDNNGLLDEAKLSHLIDVSKKDPAAIAKLISEAELDPLDLDKEKSEEYEPGTYTVTDTEVDVKATLDDIRDTASFETTVDIINNKWDDASRKVLYENPESIKTINEHIELGLYSKVWDIVESERAVGRLTNVSDIDAYKQVGLEMQKQGVFNVEPAAGEPTAEEKQATQKAIADKAAADKAKAKKVADKKRSAASPTGQAPKTDKLPEEFNILNMTDAEFAAFEAKGLI